MEEEIKVKEKPTKKQIIRLVILVIIMIIVFGAVLYVWKIRDYIDTYKHNKLVEAYQKRVDDYGKKLDEYVYEYYQKNNTLPNDIYNDSEVKALDPNISCSIILNNDATVYLHDCYVNDIDYHYSFYTYGDDRKVNAKIKFYKNSKNNRIYSDDYVYNKEDELIDVYYCESKDCKLYQERFNDSDTFLIFDNNMYYKYMPLKRLKEKTNMGAEAFRTVSFITIDNKDYGVYVKTDDGKSSVYSYESDKYLFDFSDTYDDIYLYNKDIMKQGYLVLSGYRSGNHYLYIISQLDGKVIKEISNASIISTFKSGNNTIYRAYANGYNCKEQENRIYDDKFKPLVDEIVYFNISNSDNTITIVDNEKRTSFEVYDYNQKIYSSKEYKEIVALAEDYIFVFDEDDNHLKVIDLTENVVATFPEVPEGYKILKSTAYHVKTGDDNRVSILLENKNVEYNNEKRYYKYIYDINTNKTETSYFAGNGAAICSE